MSISSVSSSSMSSALYAPSQTEPSEAASKVGRSDSDADDGQRAQTAAQPTINTLGQTVGTRVNTTA